MSGLVTRANYFTAIIAGLITVSGILLSERLRADLWSKDFKFGIASLNIAFVAIPVIFFVIGIEYIRSAIPYKIRNFGLKSFVFPSSTEDIKVLVRMLLWFATCSSVMIFRHTW